MTPTGSQWSSGIDGELAARVARLVFYALLSIVLMTLDYRGRYVDQIRGYALWAVEPAILVIEAPFALGHRLGEELRSRHELMERVAVLEQERRARLSELMLLEELADENDELRELLDASERLDLAFEAAELTRIDLDPYSHRVMINRGRRDGLEVGQPVMDSRGVIGQIEDVALNVAVVVLITDPDHALPVRVQRTGLRTVAYGSGRVNSLRLTDLPMNVDLVEGDMLVTSGLAGAFPPGLPVAEIEALARPQGEAFARADARPLGKLDRARHVLVVAVEEVPGESADPAAASETAVAGPGNEEPDA